MITVVVWKWGDLFGFEYVNTMASMLRRHLHLPYVFKCVTDDPTGITEADIIPLPHELSKTPRCIRRLRQYDPRWARKNLGERFLSLDLDMVLVDDITPIVQHPEPLVLWRVIDSVQQVYCGSFVLMNYSAIPGLWWNFAADPFGYGLESQKMVYYKHQQGWPNGRLGRPWADASDQVILNHYLRTHRVDVKTLTESDGFLSFHGNRPITILPPGTRIVVLGHDDKEFMDKKKRPWVEEHWR